MTLTSVGDRSNAGPTGEIVEWVGALTDVQDTVDAEQERANAIATLEDHADAMAQLYRVSALLAPDGSRLPAVLAEILDAVIGVTRDR